MATKKLKSTFINMVLVLCTVTLISALSLGYVFNMTKDKIAFSKEQKKLQAIKEVILPGFDNMPNKEMFTITSDNGGTLECYPAKKNGKITSIAIKTYTKMGFSGEIWLMAGFLPDGTINTTSVIDQKETPGLGTKIMGKFKDQYEGKNPGNFNIKVKKDGGNIDGITAATISSRAFSDAVARAHRSLIKHLEQNKGQAL